LTNAATRDVFIVFSKSDPLESRFALAVKHGLEELGLSAFEYEDWSWVEQGPSTVGGEVDVDRARLRSMLEESLALLVIPPPSGKLSEGVATELDLLVEMQVPAVVIQWSYPHERFERDDINVICTHQVYGSTPSARAIASHGTQLAEKLWFASTTCQLRNRFVPAGNLILDQLPAFGNEPLTSFKLRDGLVKEGDFPREPDLDKIASSVMHAVTGDQMKPLIETWWADAEPALRHLESDGAGPVRRPCRALYDAMQAVLERACERFPELKYFSADGLLRRGVALTRFGEFDDAIATLTKALAVTKGYQNRIYAARAMAYQERGDLKLALADMAAAIENAESPLDETTQRFTRAVYLAKLKTPDGFNAAIADYTRVLELSPDSQMRLRALNYRALDYARLGEIDRALADWSAVIDHHADHPRAAAQACLNRAGERIKLGSLSEAHEDLTRVLAWADASSEQRFRALEARADVNERLGKPAAAAADLKKLLGMDMADPEWRPEVEEKIRALNKVAKVRSATRRGTAG
jgi:tetratricopeptide (TPR) repeat protein